MNSSSSFPRFLTFFLVLGVFGTVLAASLPLLIAKSFNQETDRYDLCQRHLRYDCEPSIIWALRGWTGKESASTSTRAAVVTTTSSQRGSALPDGTDALPEGTDGLQIFASSSTASSTPLLLKFQSSDLVRNGSFYRGKAGSSVKISVETQETKSVTLQVGTSTTTIISLKPVSKGIFQGTMKLPKTLPVVVEMLLKNGDDFWTGYRLSVASNQ